jgi:hypothetical protein
MRISQVESIKSRVEGPFSGQGWRYVMLQGQELSLARASDGVCVCVVVRVFVCLCLCVCVSVCACACA